MREYRLQEHYVEIHERRLRMFLDRIISNIRHFKE